MLSPPRALSNRLLIDYCPTAGQHCALRCSKAITSIQAPRHIACRSPAAMAQATAQERKQQLDMMYQGYRDSFPEARSHARHGPWAGALSASATSSQVAAIQPRELQKLLCSPAVAKTVVVDTRTPEERAVSRIPGQTLSREEFEQRKEEFRDHTIVSYCTGATCFTAARSTAADHTSCSWPTIWQVPEAAAG